MWPGIRVAGFLNQNLVDTVHEPFGIDEIKDRTKEARPRRLMNIVSSSSSSSSSMSHSLSSYFNTFFSSVAAADFIYMNVFVFSKIYEIL